MNQPRKREDLDRLVANEVQESLHIEYKDSRALENGGSDVPKEVAAFANSDGGTLIFGIKEKGHKPIGIDCGVDHTKFSRERLEDIITGNIAPNIEDLEILQIPLTDTRSVYSVGIPKSSRGPHQDRKTKKYYRRYNFKAEPMEDYEIADVRGRVLVLPPLVSFDVEVQYSSIASFVLRNVGNAVAQEVKLNFTPEPTWRRPDDKPPILTRGIKFFPPGREFRIFYHSFVEIAQENTDIVSSFDVNVQYLHAGSGEQVTENFYVNLEDYLRTFGPDSEIRQMGKDLCASIKKLGDELRQFKNQVATLTTIAGSTGLDLSITATRELASILGQSPSFRRLDPTECGPRVFQEILGVDIDIARELSSHFWGTNSIEGLSELETVDQDLIDQIRLFFIVSPSNKEAP